MKRKGAWRYQAVYVTPNDDVIEYSICEVYLDKDDNLEAWTENFNISPSGNTIEELVGDIQLMLGDAKKWKAVPFDSLCVGMNFERNVLMS